MPEALSEGAGVSTHLTACAGPLASGRELFCLRPHAEGIAGVFVQVIGNAVAHLVAVRAGRRKVFLLLTLPDIAAQRNSFLVRASGEAVLRLSLESAVALSRSVVFVMASLLVRGRSRRINHHMQG